MFIECLFSDIVNKYIKLFYVVVFINNREYGYVLVYEFCSVGYRVIIIKFK